MKYTLVFFLGLVLTIFVTPYVVSFLTKNQIVDNPGERRINKKVTPRMGGLVIFSISMLLIFIFYTDLNSIRLVIFALLLITVSGTIDDVMGLRWKSKIIFQIVSALLILPYLLTFLDSVRIFGLLLPAPVGFIILVIFMVGVVNSINLLDGLDGLASGFSLLTSLLFFSISLFTDNILVTTFSAALAGSLIGFLVYNAHPAKIFMGDTGSLFLGFFLMFLGIILSIDKSSRELDLTFPIIAFGVPIVDTLKVMLLRILKKKSPFEPDKSHFHHVIFENKIQHQFSVFIVQLFTIVFLIISLLYLRDYKILSLILFLISTVLMLIFDFSFEKLKLFFETFQRYLQNILQQIPSKLFSIINRFVIPFAAITAGIFIIVLFPISTDFNKVDLLFLLIIGVAISSLALFHYYRVKEIAGIYVLVNASLYIVFSNLSTSFLNIFLMSSKIFLITYNIIFTMLFLIVVVYITVQERFISEKGFLLSGIDLILVLLFALLFVIDSLFSVTLLDKINISLYQSFILYLIFKLIFRFELKISIYILVASFLLPIISLIYLLIK